MMKTYSIWNVKGGVGKTITAVNLAAGLAAKGKRVLLIDMDGQSSVTFQMFPKREFDEEDLTITDALAGKAELKECIYPTEIENLDVVPSTIYLFTVDKQMMLNMSGVQQIKLRKMLRTVKNDYDFVITDNNPSINMCATNALCACDHLIIPANMERGALKGIELTLSYSNEILREIDGSNFDIHILPTRIGYRKTEHDTLKKLNEMYSGMMTRSLIRNQNAIVEWADLRNRPVIQYMNKKYRVSEDYRCFVEEICERED